MTLTDQNFDEEIKKATQPVLVDFWAPWCLPCQMMAPVLEELAKDYEEKLIIGKVDVDANPKTAQKFNVMSIPTLIIFKNGKPVKQMVGYQSKENIMKELRILPLDNSQ